MEYLKTFITSNKKIIPWDKIVFIEPVYTNECFMSSDCGWSLYQLTVIGDAIFKEEKIYNIYDKNVQKMFGIDPKELKSINLPEEVPEIIAYKVHLTNNSYLYINVDDYKKFKNYFIIY